MIMKTSSLTPGPVFPIPYPAFPMFSPAVASPFPLDPTLGMFPQTPVTLLTIAKDNPAKVKALQSASDANSIAVDALKQIAQLQSTSEEGDTFTLKKIQDLTDQALAQAGAASASSDPEALRSAENASYIAQSAIEKLGHLQFGATSPANGVAQKLNRLA